jgi:hypothetical protein
MNPDSFYGNEEQREQHLRAIQSLIKEGRYPAEEITRLYTLVLKEYEKEAKVKTFLPILITKRVKEMIEAESQ